MWPLGAWIHPLESNAHTTYVFELRQIVSTVQGDVFFHVTFGWVPCLVSSELIGTLHWLWLCQPEISFPKRCMSRWPLYNVRRTIADGAKQKGVPVYTVCVHVDRSAQFKQVPGHFGLYAQQWVTETAQLWARVLPSGPFLHHFPALNNGQPFLWNPMAFASNPWHTQFHYECHLLLWVLYLDILPEKSLFMRWKILLPLAINYEVMRINRHWL